MNDQIKIDEKEKVILREATEPDPNTCGQPGSQSSASRRNSAAQPEDNARVESSSPLPNDTTSDTTPKQNSDVGAKLDSTKKENKAATQSNESLVALAMHPDTPEKEWLDACHELNSRNISLPCKPPKRVNKARRIQLAGLALLLCTVVGAAIGSYWQKQSTPASAALTEPPYNQTAATVQTITIKNKIAIKLANSIHERGMSNTETAKYLGIPEETVKEILRGKASELPLQKKIELLYALDVPVSVSFNKDKNWQRSGMGDVQKEDCEEALKFYTRLIAQTPDDSSAYFQRAQTHSDLRQYEQAVKDYTKALELKPDLNPALNNREGIYMTTGRFDKALQDNDELLRREPGDWGNYSMRGIILQQLGKLDEALVALNKAVEMAPQRPGPLWNRASVLEEKHKYKEAVADLSSILEKDPTSSAARDKIGELTKKISH